MRFVLYASKNGSIKASHEVTKLESALVFGRAVYSSGSRECEMIDHLTNTHYSPEL